ncbi:MAG: DUF4097 family beta strand repeat-containing protein [Acidimicrobiia bacterium]
MEPVRVTASSGRIEVTAEDRGDIAVERGQDHPMGGILEVQGASSGVRLRVPVGTDLVVGTHSGRVDLHGELGEVRITTRSGAVTIERCRDLDARTVSGRIDVGTVTGDARLKAASGRITVGRVGGELHATSVSGRVEIGDADGEVRVTSVNGRVEVGLNGSAPVRCETVSGAICLEVPATARPHTSLRSVSGRCVCDLPEGDDADVVGRSISGTITVRARS